jgi:hypothetical protein
MKNLISLILIFSHQILTAQNMSAPPLRLMYYHASQNSRDADKLYNLVKNSDSTMPVLLGYKAMAEFMKCYHSFNPVNKLTYFYKGKSDLDKAILSAPNNIELRYLRITVQTNAPVFLNYRNQIPEDMQRLIQQLSVHDTDAELNSMIRKYMLNCGCCSENEKEFFKTLP